MSKTEKFRAEIESGYTFNGDSIILGTTILNGEALEKNLIRAPLKTFNRHGLIAGATGTGKTKTLQNLAERLSENGVPTLLMDLKGDLSGLAAAGNPHPKIDERHQKIGTTWKATKYPVELLTLSNEKGAKLRATVSEFGPVLFSKVLGLNDTQGGVVSIVFKYCDDNSMPLLDLKDFKKVIQHITSDEGKAEIEAEYGRISTASTGAILRKVVELEQQGADKFFGETSFDVQDLLRVDERGYGYNNIIRLTDIQDKPKLFSTFMLCLLAEIYNTFPEQGDKDNPKLVIFIDEAHLIFNEASKELLNQIESIIKLIRSKGVGIFFCTQVPSDVPDSILSQLGMKVQHALRAFTAKDRKAIKMVAENYPITEFYNTSEVLTTLGIGEALITVLNEKGIPTPLAHTLLGAPSSRMDILSTTEIDDIFKKSDLVEKYNKEIDRESAYEILNKKIERATAEIEEEEEDFEEETKSRKKEEPSFIEKASKNTMVRQLGRTILRELTRGLFGVLGLSSTPKRRTTRRKRRY